MCISCRLGVLDVGELLMLDEMLEEVIRIHLHQTLEYLTIE